MNSPGVIWMGLGIFDRLYSEKKIKNYFDVLNTLPNKKVFILADELAGTNNFVLSGKKFDVEKHADTLEQYKQKSHAKFVPKYEYIQHLMQQSSQGNNWDVQYWNFLSHESGYKDLLQKIHMVTQDPQYEFLKKEALRITIFGFGARLRKNFTESFVQFVFDKNFYQYLDTLSEYTLAEVAATLHLAKQGWIKAGHDEEKSYDGLSAVFHKHFQAKWSLSQQPPEFYYL